ncbi:Uncharacterised protein [Vibrio cholerae]|uniref:Uncharacterized protein n=1 Tax=Vibrio cholerae TaxID=666 RepID=A0A655XF08_VIBCL|nr:Uncharacterised protein [Vibrio cholerae]
MVTIRDTATRQTDLTNHGRQYRAHPVRLLPVLLTLDTPTKQQLCTTIHQHTGEIADRIGFHATDCRCPLWRFFNLIFALTQYVRDELFKAQAVSFNELLVVQVFGIQHMRYRQHERHVSLWVDV